VDKNSFESSFTEEKAIRIKERCLFTPRYDQFFLCFIKEKGIKSIVSGSGLFIFSHFFARKLLKKNYS
jgi:hypothetical protein